MAEVELIIRKNGSTLVKGEVVLKDQDGNVITPPNTPFALCRCGASTTKPFCDGSHKRIGFDDSPRAAENTPVGGGVLREAPTLRVLSYSGRSGRFAKPPLIPTSADQNP